MIVLRRIIDVMAQGSARPVRRLLAYYMVVAMIVIALAYAFPGLVNQVAGKGLEVSTGGQLVLQDGLGALNPVVRGVDPGSLVELTLTTLLIFFGTLALMLPVTWVYMSARAVAGHSQAIVQTMIILPLVVAGIIIVVQNSLALAFSLAGVVAAVRFRTTLRDSRDTVFIFLSIAVGFAAGVQALAVAALLSVVFNLVLLLVWRYDYGRNMLTPTAASQWAAPLENLASASGQAQIPDRDLVLSLTPNNADALADRFERVSEVLGKKQKKPRYDAVLAVTTDHVSEAQAVTEKVVGKLTKRWRLDEVVNHTGKPCEIFYLVRLKKGVPREEVLTAIHEKSGGMIASANLEVRERLEETNGKPA